MKVKTSSLAYQLASYRSIINGFFMSVTGHTNRSYPYRYGSVSENLCPFFWEMVFGFMTLLIDAAILSGTIMFLFDIATGIMDASVQGMFIAYAIGGLESEAMWSGLSFFAVFTIWSVAAVIISGAILSAVICAAISLLAVICGAINAGGEFLYEKVTGGEPKEKSPSIALEYIKSKHEKICPRIEFED